MTFKFEKADNDSEGFAGLMADPTRCYVKDCIEENDLLLHVQDEPQWGGADLCQEHALDVIRGSEFIRHCDCVFCKRALKYEEQHR